MRALLDVNVLIALLDADHVSHHAARSWFAAHAALGWASCATTQNGCLRIMSHPGYPNVRPIADIAERLRRATAQPQHVFWSESVSILDPAQFDHTRLHGPRQLSEAYLLALAVSNGGRLVTFDRSLSLGAVVGATTEHLVML